MISISANTLLIILLILSIILSLTGTVLLHVGKSKESIPIILSSFLAFIPALLCCVVSINFILKTNNSKYVYLVNVDGVEYSLDWEKNKFRIHRAGIFGFGSQYISFITDDDEYIQTNKYTYKMILKGDK